MMTDPRLLQDVQHPMHAMIAPIGPEPQPLTMADNSSPDLSAVSTPHPQVVRQMSPLERYQQAVGNRMSKDLDKDANPYGSATNHPGVMGKILHGISVATGGPNRRQFEEQGLGKQLQDSQNDQGKQSLQQAQTDNLNSEIKQREKPPEEETEKPYTLNTDKGILQWDGSHWAPVEVNGVGVNTPEREAAARGFQHVSGTSGGKEMYANYDPSKGVYTDLTGNILTDFKPKDKAMQGAYGGFGPAFLAYRMLNSAYNENPELLPYIAPMIAKMLSGAGANVSGLQEAIGKVPEGQPQNESGTPIGLRMPGAPTGATRSRGQFAESVLPSMQDAQTEIQKLGDKLGPMAGRYNDLATSKIGAYGPEFSGLQTTLHNVATAWMRLHANSESARQDFVNQLNSAQDPANLMAVLNSIEKQAKDYVAQGKGRGGQDQPKIGDVKTFPNGRKGVWDGKGYAAQ